ncbi:MAG: hypothetical protein ACRD2B_01315 [Terriglobia bacterium]
MRRTHFAARLGIGRAGWVAARRSLDRARTASRMRWRYTTLTRVASDSSAVLAYVGAETKLGISVEHIQISETLPLQPQMTPLIQRLSSIDVYLDASSGLPVALDSNVHPDDNAAINIPAEIRYSNYRLVGGIARALPYSEIS